MCENLKIQKTQERREKFEKQKRAIESLHAGFKL